jgi:hypothetical protein
VTIEAIQAAILLGAAEPGEHDLGNGLLARFKDDASYIVKLHGRYHREDGPAIEHSDGSAEWWKNGVRHREDGPALINVDWSQEFWLNVPRHREDGPAIEWADGSHEWWLNGKKVKKLNKGGQHEIDDVLSGYS